MVEYIATIKYLTSEFVRNTKNDSEIERLIADFDKEIGVSIDKQRALENLLHALTMFDENSYIKEMQARKDKGLGPTVEVRKMIGAAVDYLQPVYESWRNSSGYEDKLFLTNEIIAFLVSAIVTDYIDYYGDDEFYINYLGQVRKRESASPDANRPQRGQQKVNGKRGRPKKSFKDLMINDADGSKLERIRALMQGKKGKPAALVMLAAMDLGWIERPTHAQVEKEFGYIGVQQGFTKYLDKTCFSDEEIVGMKSALEG